MKSLVGKAPTVARIALGLAFVLFGANKLVPFLPQPPVSGAPAAFFGALFATGYMLPLIGITEVVAGLLLVSGRFVPLALTLLAPVLVNIVGFHAFLAHGGYALPAFLVALEVYLAWTYRDAFAPMLAMKAAQRGNAAALPPSTVTTQPVVAFARAR